MKNQRITTEEVKRLILHYVEYLEDPLILESSAGEGNVVDFLNERGYHNIHCFELNKEKRDTLKEKEHTVIGANFLEYSPAKYYDIVLSLPPYKKDIEHITHGLEYLSEEGILVSLCSPRFLTENTPKAIEFRNLIYSKRKRIIMIAENSFIEKKKNVPSIILVLWN